MSFKIVPLDKKKHPESWLGWGARNIAGGLNRALDTAGQAVRAVSDPVGYSQNKILSNLGFEKPIDISAPKIQSLEPKNSAEDYLQHLISGVALTGATGGIKSTGAKFGNILSKSSENGLKETVQQLGSKALSGIKSTVGAATNIITHDIGRNTAKKLGAGEIGQTIGGIAAQGLGRSVLPSKYKENFHPIEKSLYKKVKGEGHYKIASGEINNLAKQFIEDEQRRTGGKSKYIRRLDQWINQSEGGKIKSEDLHNLKKDLNQYIYREYNSPGYLKALEIETHKQISAAGKNGARTETNLTLPSWSKNLRKADKLHSLLTEGDWNKTPDIIKWLFKKFIPGRIVYEGGKRLATPIELGVRFPMEFGEFFAKNTMKAIEKNPGSFQSEIKKLNHLLKKEDSSKSGFVIKRLK